MKNIKLAILTSLLTLSTGMAYAEPACNQFEVKINNSLSDDLLVTTINMDGANLQPGGIQKINGKESQVFTVNASQEGVPMSGEFIFHTISVPSKVAKIKFDLKNSGLICEHTDQSPDSDFSLFRIRLPGKIEYTINNK